MKKTILLLALWLSVSGLFAQDYGEPNETGAYAPAYQEEAAGNQLLSKRGLPILPEAGDWALGFNAIPFLEYAGNIFNGTNGNSVFADFPNSSQQIFVKYFLADDMAVRARLGVDNQSYTERNRVLLDNQPIPDPSVEVTDEWTWFDTEIELGVGLEFRRGSGRVVGVYGVEVAAYYGNAYSTYEYGNPLTQDNISPTTTPWLYTINNGRFERLSESKEDKDFGVGAGGFLGVEYFFAPKISVGAEFTFGVAFRKNFREADTWEFWHEATNSIENRVSISEGDENFTIQTGNYGGSINLLFYF